MRVRPVDVLPSLHAKDRQREESATLHEKRGLAVGATTSGEDGVLNSFADESGNRGVQAECCLAVRR